MNLLIIIFNFIKIKEPWEFSDGSIYLLSQLASVNSEAGMKFIPLLSELVKEILV